MLSSLKLKSKLTFLLKYAYKSSQSIRYSKEKIQKEKQNPSHKEKASLLASTSLKQPQLPQQIFPCIVKLNQELEKVEVTNKPSLPYLKAQNLSINTSAIPPVLNSTSLQHRLFYIFRNTTECIVKMIRDQEISRHIEPSFELYLRKAIYSMKKAGYDFKITYGFVKHPKDKIQILNIKYVKGMFIKRAQNDTINKYIKIQRSQGVLQYIPKTRNKNNILVIQLGGIISLPYHVKIKDPKTGSEQTLPSLHYVQFENQLQVPKIGLNLQHISKQKIITQCKISHDKWILTNINQSNPYSGFQFTKKQGLVTEIL